MEKYITPRDFDSLAEVQSQIDQFINVSHCAEALISSGLLRGNFDIALKMPDDLMVEIYSRGDQKINVANIFTDDISEHSGIIFFDNKFPLTVNELRSKRSKSNPNEINIDCSNTFYQGRRIEFVASNLSNLIFAVNYR